jgi:hypothetical protein
MSLASNATSYSATEEFMEPEGSLPYSQESYTYRPHPIHLSKISFNIIIPLNNTVF